MNDKIEHVLAVLDGFRMSDEMTYPAYSVLHDEISMLDDLLKAQEPQYVYDCAEMIDDIVVGKCPSCDRTIVNKINDPTRFCKYCGQAVKWE